MFKKILTVWLCVLFLCCFSVDLMAKNPHARPYIQKQENNVAEPVPSDETLLQIKDPQNCNCDPANAKAIPPSLDPKFRHHKDGQFEFAVVGGSYLGNTLDQTWTAGGKLFYHLNDTFAFGPSYSYVQLLTDKTTRFGSAMETKSVHIVDAELMVSNDAAFRSGNSIIEFDFYFTLGVGSISINNDWQPVGMVGGGVKFYPGISWFALRIDVNNYMHVTEQPGKNNFDADVAFLGGLSFLFPPKPSPKYKK